MYLPGILQRCRTVHDAAPVHGAALEANKGSLLSAGVAACVCVGGKFIILFRTLSRSPISYSVHFCWWYINAVCEVFFGSSFEKEKKKIPYLPRHHSPAAGAGVCAGVGEPGADRRGGRGALPLCVVSFSGLLRTGSIQQLKNHCVAVRERGFQRRAAQRLGLLVGTGATVPVARPLQAATHSRIQAIVIRFVHHRPRPRY